MGEHLSAYNVEERLVESEQGPPAETLDDDEDLSLPSEHVKQPSLRPRKRAKRQRASRSEQALVPAPKKKLKRGHHLRVGDSFTLKFTNGEETDHSVEGKLGEGGFGSVFSVKRVTRTGTVSYLALKTFFRKYSGEKELVIQKRLEEKGFGGKHGLAVMTSFYEDNDSHLYIQMDRYRCSLQLYLDTNTLFNDKGMKNLFFQVLSGLEHLREGGIIHCDVKPANILVRMGTSYTLEFALSDFGLSVVATEALIGQMEAGGTKSYHSSELIRGDPSWSYPIDCFALGATLLQVLANMPESIFYRDGSEHVRIEWIEYVVTNVYYWGEEDAASELMTLYPDATEYDRRFCALVTRLLDPDPDMRATAREIIDDYKDFFNSL